MAWNKQTKRTLVNESPTILKLLAIQNNFWSDLFVECDLYQICDAEGCLVLIWDAMSVKRSIYQMLFQTFTLSMIYCLNNNSFGSCMKQSHLSVLENVTRFNKAISFVTGSCCPCRLFFQLPVGHVTGREHLVLSV